MHYSSPGIKLGRSLVAAASLISSLVILPSAHAGTVGITLTRVGNPGNKADTTGYGSVATAYSISVYDVTLTQYTKFLNAVARTDKYALYDLSLGTGDHIKGISRTGADGAYKYAVIGNGANPVTYVSWLDAARFCNWLQNGEPETGVENSATTEDGAYALNGDTTTGKEMPTAAAKWWIPTEDQWYKAAYYDPTLDNNKGGYWLYPTRSDVLPTNDYKAPAVANQANFINAADEFSVTQSAVEVGTQNYLTPVGSFTKSASYYGTFDQGGDVYQWNDAQIGAARGVRGGSWDLDSSYLRSLTRDSRQPTGENPGVGFRVASSYLPN